MMKYKWIISLTMIMVFGLGFIVGLRTMAKFVPHYQKLPTGDLEQIHHEHFGDLCEAVRRLRASKKKILVTEEKNTQTLMITSFDEESKIYRFSVMDVRHRIHEEGSLPVCTH